LKDSKQYYAINSEPAMREDGGKKVNSALLIRKDVVNFTKRQTGIDYVAI
jgi:hypothetical protein